MYLQTADPFPMIVNMKILCLLNTGEVLVGSQMPNLMYMTSFENMNDRDQHWDAFREAPAWADLKVQEEYANTVSKIHIYLLHPTGYSDL